VAGFDWNGLLEIEQWEDLAVIVEEMELRKLRLIHGR
jgi:hypothetical protein